MPKEGRPRAHDGHALVSALTGVPTRADIAMNGEITLRGSVLPIGGLNEKAVAARRAESRRSAAAREREGSGRNSRRGAYESRVRSGRQHGQVLQRALDHPPRPKQAGPSGEPDSPARPLRSLNDDRDSSAASSTRTFTRLRLFTPGPVEIPARVLRALSQIPPHPRTEVFRATFQRVTNAMRDLHRTEGEVFLLAASGTGAMEAAVTNLMSPGEKALAVIGGKFGERWKKLLEAYGVPHDAVDAEWGKAVDPALVEAALARDPAITTVFATHSETSTGAIHDVEAFAKITRARGKRLVIDAITSLGVHPIPQDAWGIDVIVCGSQKGLMAPPGVASVSLAPWAAAAIGAACALLLRPAQGAQECPDRESAFTTAVSLVLALEEALAMIHEKVSMRTCAPSPPRACDARVEKRRLFVVLVQSLARRDALVPPSGIDGGTVVKRLRDLHAWWWQRAGSPQGQDLPHRPHGRLRFVGTSSPW